MGDPQSGVGPIQMNFRWESNEFYPIIRSEDDEWMVKCVLGSVDSISHEIDRTIQYAVFDS